VARLSDEPGDLRAKGYYLLPLPPRRKFPPPTGWNLPKNRDTTHELPPGCNVALATGPSWGGPVVVIANDARATEYFTGMFGPPTVWAHRGPHWWFRAPAGTEGIAASTFSFGEAEMHSDGRYVLIPPDVHPSGEVYRWDHGPAPPLADLPELPDDIREVFGVARSGDRAPASVGRVAGKVPYGARRRVLCREARTLARAGLPEEQIREQLRLFQEAEFPPERPGDRRYADGAAYVARWAVRYYSPAPNAVPVVPQRGAPVRTIRDVLGDLP